MNAFLQTLTSLVVIIAIIAGLTVATVLFLAFCWEYHDHIQRRRKINKYHNNKQW